MVPGYLLEEARQELGATPAAAAAAYGRFCRELLEGLRDVVPAVKVQSACFDVLGSAGTAAMQEILAYARDLGYYVLLDSMRGDVTDIAQRCAQAVFGTVEEAGPGYQPYPCDAITVNGYLGGDSIKPFLPYCRDGGKSLFILVKTSNRSSVEVQDLLSGGRLVHTAMADLVNRWGGGALGQIRLFPGGRRGGRALSGDSQKPAGQIRPDVLPGSRLWRSGRHSKKCPARL